MFDWGYDTEPEPRLDNRRIEAMRGKVLGGSSSINVMAYVRGHRGDYDRWANDGARGWSYADVLPYFKRCESWEKGENTWRGGGGPLGVIDSRNHDPLFDAWLAAAQEADWPFTEDYNGKEQEGFGVGQWTIRAGRRCSAAVAFLRPAMRRPNLTVETGALAARVMLEGTRAVGVEYARSGRVKQARAAREVLLAGGVFNTPQLMMLSGIGEAEHLREVGIEPVVDVPGVGRNLQDHLSVTVAHSRKGESRLAHTLRADRIAWAMLRAYIAGKGPARAAAPSMGRCVSIAWPSTWRAPISSARGRGPCCRAGYTRFSRRGASCRCPTSSSCSAARRPALTRGSPAFARPTKTASACAR